jgi:hypothetical protein
MIDEWNEIASELNIKFETESGMKDWRNPWNSENLEQFERENRIHLPHEYKEFSIVLGPGVLGNWIHILDPDIQTLRMSRTWSNSTIKMIERSPSKNTEADQELIELIDNIFIFSMVDGPYQGFFDLDTYSEADKSCDIIWTSKDVHNTDEWYSVGRGFFSFFSEYFLGQRLVEILSQDYIDLWEELTNSSFYIDNSFAPYS